MSALHLPPDGGGPHACLYWYYRVSRQQVYHPFPLSFFLIFILSYYHTAHPIIPFITEKIWQEIKSITKNNGNTIMMQPFPIYNKSLIDEKAVIDLDWIQKVITAIRTIRAKMSIKHTIPLHIIFKNAPFNIKQCITNNYNILLYIARLKNINFVQKNKTFPKSISVSLDKIELLILIPDTFNQHIEINRLKKELKLINQKIKNITNILNNHNFKNKAPKIIIMQKQKQLNHFKENKNMLINQYSIIKSL